MGPWSHGGWSRGEGSTLGNLDFNSQTGAFFREQIELPFFLANLKGKGNGLKATSEGSARFPEACVFETGSREWVRFDSWPPKNATEASLYLNAKGKLSWTQAKDVGFDEYLSDLTQPSP